MVALRKTYASLKKVCPKWVKKTLCIFLNLEIHDRVEEELDDGPNFLFWRSGVMRKKRSAPWRAFELEKSANR